MNLRVQALAAIVVAAGSAAAWLAAPCAAADGPAAPVREEPPLRYRRVYAPADRLKDWPRDDARYVPVDAAEFDRLIAAIEARRGAAELPQSTWLVAARYKARLVGQTLVDGEAIIDLAPPADVRTRLALHPWSLAAAEAFWEGDPPLAAELAAGPDGKLGVVAEHPGRLVVKWSLRGRRDASGSIDFDFELPPCPASRLVVDLPKDFSPIVERLPDAGPGPDSRVPGPFRTASEAAVAVREATGADAGVVWRIELGGRRRFKLRVTPTDHLDPSRNWDAVRQATTYDVSLRGVDVTAQWTIDVHDVPLKRLGVELDPGLRLVGARYGETALRWSAASPGGAGKKTLVAVELPEPLRGPGRVVRLSAMGPVDLGRRWRLPEMRPQGLFWQEGTVKILVPAPLAIEHLAAAGARQTGTGPLPAPRTGEVVDLQCFGPAAGVDVVLARPQAPLQWDCGAAVDLGGVEMSAQIAAYLQVAEGEQFQVTADVGRRWSVHSVESVPADALDDWTQDATAGGRLTVRLAKGILPARPLRLLITAHSLPWPQGRPLASDDLFPLRFHGRPGQQLLSLRTKEGYQMKLIGAERWASLDSQGLAAAERELLGGPSRGPVFRYDSRAPGFRVQVEAQKPSFSATIRVEATAGRDSLTESYEVRCVPESAQVDRVVVRFSHPRSAPLRWTLVGEETEPLAAERRPSDPASKAPQPETWEIRLRRPRNSPIELRAVRTVPLAGPQSVSLASLPDAATQRGAVVVGVSGASALRIKNHRLTPVPPETVPVNRSAVWRGSFRYDPAADAGASREGALVLSPVEPNDLPPAAWVWSCHLESRYDAEGAARHLAVYRIENTGREQLALALPAEVSAEDVLGAWIDETRTGWKPAEGPDGAARIEVRLPAGRRFPVVSVHFVVRGTPLGIGASLAPPLPEADLPVLERDWTVWLPPGYRTAPSGAATRCEAPRALSERIFGPFARRARDAADEMPSGVWPWSHGERSDRARARTRVEEFLARLARTEAAMRQPEPAAKPAAVAWGDLLARTAEGQGSRCLVDRPAAARARLTARTPVGAATAQSPAARGAALLHQANLAVLAASDVLLLTGRVEAALHRRRLTPLDLEGAWAVAPGPLDDQIREASETATDPCLVPAHVWGRVPAESETAWAAANLEGYGPTDATGWTAGRFELPADCRVRVSVVQHDAMEVIRWTALVASLSLAWWLGRRRPTRLAVSSGLLAAAAMVVPEIYAPACSGAFLGTLAGLLLSHLRPAPAASGSSADPSRSSTRRVTTAAVGAGVLLWWVCATEGKGAEKAAAISPATPPSATVYNVFIPTDAQQKPTGQKYFVPERFYGELERLSAASPEEPHPWELAGAAYRGTLAWQSTPEQLVIQDLKAVYDLRVVGRRVRVRLPLGGEAATRAPAGALLDGRAVAVRGIEGGGLELEVADPGQYRLELPLRPTLHAGGGLLGFEMPIPPLATSRLELAVPRDAPSIETPTALGSVAREVDPSRLVAQLGPTDRLAVRWQEGTGRVPGGPLLDVEQLLWMKIQPGAVVVETLLRCRMLQGRVRRMELAVDPRLRLAPLEGDRSWLGQIETMPGIPQTVRFELAPTAPDQFTAELSFLLTERSGVGGLRLPLLEVLGARTTKRWLAVSVDPGLHYEQRGGERLQALAVPMFMAVWGAAKSEPLFAYSLATAEPLWSIATRPIATRTVADQTLTVSVGHAAAQIGLEAHLVTQPGPRYQYRLVAPSQLEIERIAVMEQTAERPARWARGPGGQVTVFLNGPVAGKHTLSLRGRAPVTPSGSLAVPVLRVEAEETNSLVVQVLRDSAVQVEIAKVAGLAETDPASADDGRIPVGRLVKCFRAGGPDPPLLTLTVKPNQPRLRAEQITSLRCEGDAWEVEADFRVTVAGGVADEFRLDVPREWPGPYRVQPPEVLKVTDSPGTGRRELVVRPRAAVEGPYRFRVAGPLALSPGERPSVPRIALEQVELTRRLLVLPVQAQLQPLSWETRGLVRDQLPEDYPVPAAARDSFVAYQVVHEPFRTILRSLGQVSGISQVHLADVSLAWHSDGTCHGVAAFDLEPAGLAESPLELPEGCRLVQVAVDGLPAVPTALGGNQFTVPLSLSTLPQRLEVVFEGPVAELGADGIRKFAVPRLGDLPVRLTLWTIAAPPGRSMEEPGRSGRLAPLEQEMLRLRNLGAVSELAADFPDEDPALAARWYLPWARRWRASFDEAQRRVAQADDPAAAQAARAEMETVRRRQTQTAERLRAVEVLAQVSSETPVASAMSDLWLRTIERPDQAARGSVEGGVGAISLVCGPTEPASGLRPMACSLAVLGLTLALAAAISRPSVGRLLAQWPQGLGLAAGLAWWWWLAPSLFGAAVAAASALGLLYAAWRRWRTGKAPARP